ncbi:hypothetical protein HDU96_007616 [Phlyctochytrium bullatum]|nr:hypothetical protein HDU96_007616 [Phlyctochytrium bullatum]
MSQFLSPGVSPTMLVRGVVMADDVVDDDVVDDEVVDDEVVEEEEKRLRMPSNRPTEERGVVDEVEDSE